MFGGKVITGEVKQGSGLVFGLNKGAKMTKFEYNPNGGKDNSPGDCIDIVIELKGKEFKERFYDITTGFFVNNVMALPGTPDYIANVGAEVDGLQAIIIHYMKAVGTTQEKIDQATATPISTFAQWATVMSAIIPKDMATKELDIFLQYQWNIKGSNTVTFLELPNTPNKLKQGAFVIPSVPGKFTKVEGVEGLSYVNETGVIHPFVRTEWFMESNYAKKQSTEAASNPLSNTPAATAADNTAKWGN